MSLASVKISEEVWLTCVTHALTTETEEIMGLLLGDIQLNGGNATALIWGTSPQVRSDRRKDRVETNPEQLAAASAQADRMTLTTGRTTRVIGWYHSHPHHTVLPSHVDVRTQAMYQLLDPGFIGLIFSCFGEDAQKVGRIQVIAFQSLDGKPRHVPAIGNRSVIEVESSWSSSENGLSTSVSALTESLEQDTGDSRATKGKQRMKGLPLVVYNADALHNTETDIDSPDMTASMQEALHRSNMDVSGAEYVRKEVALHVVPTKNLVRLESPLKSFTEMQRVLFEEEGSAYKNAIEHNIRNGKIHPLTYIHHASTYQASLCKLIEYCLSPAVNALQDRLKENEIRLAMLMKEGESLELETMDSKVKLESPHRLGFRGPASDLAHARSPSGRRMAS